MPPLAVFFDFDGVLADTENVHIAAWQLTLSRIGMHVPDETAARAAEIDDRTWIAELFAERGIERADVDGWCERKQELTIRMLGDSPVIYPGAVDLVRALAGRARLAVVSTTWRANVAAVLYAAGIAEAFELVVAKEDVVKVKPDPEAYRLAAERMGIAPDRAVAIEDSPSGLAAAVGAGVPALAVGHRRPTGEWHESAVGYVQRLVSVSAVLDALGFGEGPAAPNP